ncbi:MAG: tetratricopeptide repeat protein, partial [bacterium]
MKAKFSPVLVFIITLGSITAAFSQTLILGRVVDADSNAVPFTTVRLPGLSATQANQQGYFEFRLTPKAAKEFYLRSGVDLYIAVEKEGMVMLEPPDQKIRLPHNPDIQPQFRIVMVKKGSPLLARNERMLEYILRQKIQAAIEAKEQELTRRDVLAEEAQRLGLAKETLLAAVAEYKDRLRTSTDLNLRGLAALDDANEAKEFKNKQQKLAEAKNNFREAIAKDERDVRKGHEAETRLPNAYYNLGLTFFDEARYDSAAFFFAKADSAKPNDADRLNMWGRALGELAFYDQALQKFRRAYSIDSTAYGPNHSEVASRLNNIAFVLKSKGDYDGALAKYSEALAIFEKAFGRNHPYVAATLNNIALVLEEKGDYVGALAKYNEALAIDERYFGRNHPK